jgi:hypothetical protein
VTKRKIVKFSALLAIALVLALSLGDTAVRVKPQGDAANPFLASASAPSATLRRDARGPRSTMLAGGAEADLADMCYEEQLGASDAANRLAALAGALPGGAPVHRTYGAPSIGDAEVGSAYGGSASSATGSGGSGAYPLYGGAGGSGGSGGAGNPGGGGVVPPSTSQSVAEPSSVYMLCAGLVMIIFVARQFSRKITRQINCVAGK